MRPFRVLICIGFISGCSTGYQSHTWSGGYKDTNLGDGFYAVEYLGNGTNSPEIVRQYWHQRAGELCPTGYVVQSFTEGSNSVDTAALVGTVVVPISSDHPWVKGRIKCK